MSKNNSNFKTKFAVGFVLFLILIAAVLRVKLHYYPTTQTIQPVDEDAIFSQIEEDLFASYANQVPLESSPPEITSQTQIVTPAVNAQSVLKHIYTHELEGRRLSSIQALDDGYIQSYVNGQEIYIQRYDTDFQLSGDPVLVGESVTELEADNYQPQLFVNDTSIIVFSVRMVNDQLTQHFTVFDHELNSILDWQGLIHETDSQWQIESARIVMTKENVIVATPSNEESMSLTYYDLAGQLVREHILNNIGLVRDILIDQQDVIIVSQLNDQTMFSKITNQEAELQQFAFADELTSIDALVRTGDYVFMVGNQLAGAAEPVSVEPVSIVPLTKNLSSVFSSTAVTNLNSIYHSIGMNHDKLFVSYVVPVTEVQADQTVISYKTYVDEYEITPHDITQ